MKCRKERCARSGGKGKLTDATVQGLKVYECNKCGRRWAVGKLAKRGRKLRTKEQE